MIKKNEKIKILHVVGAMNAGGLESLIMNIYRSIDRSKYQFDFVVQTTQNCYFDAEIKQLGGRIISHPKPGKNFFLFEKKLEKTLEKYGPYDVVHSHVLHFSGRVLKIAKRSKVPVRIAHSHSVKDNKGSSLSRKIYRMYMQKLILNNANVMLGCSIDACKYLFGEKRIRKKQALVFPNSIDLLRYEGLDSSKSQIRKEFNIKKEEIVIGHVGRFTESKNHKFIIDLFKRFSTYNPDSHLLLVGEGSDKSKIMNYTKEKKVDSNVHFLGTRSDVPAVLKAMDLFLFPSKYEGLGIVLVEAQATGIPSVVSTTIPEEADCKMNLVSKVSLKSDESIWLTEMESSLNKAIPDWEIRKRTLQHHGYDINKNIDLLLNIYNSQETISTKG